MTDGNTMKTQMRRINQPVDTKWILDEIRHQCAGGDWLARRWSLKEGGKEEEENTEGLMKLLIREKSSLPKRTGSPSHVTNQLHYG